MPRTSVGAVAMVLGVGLVACSDAEPSTWATEANKICSEVVSTWSTLDPNTVSDDDRQQLLADLRDVAKRLAAIDAARRGVEGLEGFLAYLDSDGEAPTDIEWISALREAGADACWSMFHGSL